MQRSLLPTLFASLGLILFTLVTTMPLFEWQISGVVKNFSPNYQFSNLPSPWITKLGESLDDGSYILHTIFVSNEGGTCLDEKEVSFVVRRSPNEKALERGLLRLNEIIQWVDFWALAEIVLLGIYIWWFTIWHERPISEAVIFTVVAVAVFCLPTAILRLYLPKSVTDYFVVSDACYGTLIFDARLSKIHYGTLLVLFAAILAEIGAVGIMLHEVVKAIIQRKESAKSAVG